MTKRSFDHLRGSAATRRRAWWRWYLPLLVLCIAWCYATPIFASPDEGTHVYRSVAVGHGQLTGPERLRLGYTTEVRIPATYGRMAFNSLCFLGKPHASASCVKRLKEQPKIVSLYTVMGRYPPLYYILTAAPSRWFSPVTSVYAMRLLAALVCAAFLASAFVSAQQLGPWVVFGLAAGVTPVVIYLSSVVNPSGIELAAAASVWTSSTLLARGPTIEKRTIVRLVVALAFFLNVRSLSPILALAALVLPFCLARRRRVGELFRMRFVHVAAIVVAISAATALVWIEFFGRVKQTSDIDTRFTLGEGAVRTWWLFQESVAVFGNPDVFVRWVIWIFLALWAALVVIAVSVGTNRERLVLGVLIFGSIAFPLVISFAHPAPINTFFLGRYSLPLWMGVPILSGVVAQARASSSRPPRRVIWVVPAVLIGICHVWAFAAAARRYAVSTIGRIVYVEGRHWSGPLPQALLLVAAIAGAAAIAWQLACVQNPAPVSDADPIATKYPQPPRRTRPRVAARVRQASRLARVTLIACVGQPCAASTILSSDCAVGSTTIAMPSSSRSNTPGAQKLQLPEPMHASRSMLISSAITTTLVGRRAQPATAQKRA